MAGRKPAKAPAPVAQSVAPKATKNAAAVAAAKKKADQDAAKKKKAEQDAGSLQFALSNIYLMIVFSCAGSRCADEGATCSGRFGISAGLSRS